MSEAGTIIALVPVALVPQVAFAPGEIEDIIASVERDARQQAEDLDISTPKGRAAVKSLAYKVAQTKTGLDGLGKDLTDAIRKQTDTIMADRRLIAVRMDALRDEIRKPVDDWEAEEDQRIADHEAALRQLAACPVFLHDPTVDEIDARGADLKIIFDRPWKEFTKRAGRVYEEAAASLVKRRAETVADIQAAAEAARVEAELAEQARLAAEQAQREREVRIAEEAAETARKEAEARAAEAAEAARQAAEAVVAEQARVAAEALEAAEQARWAVEEQARQDREAAAQREADAERERKRVAAQAEATAAAHEHARILLEADRQAALDRAAAIQAQQEADAVAAEEARKRREVEHAAQVKAAAVRFRADAAATAKRTSDQAALREQDRPHRVKIHAEILAALKEIALASLSETQAMEIVEAIAAGQIPHLTISY